MRPTKTLWEICQIRTGKKDANYWTDDGQYAFFTCWKEILKAPDYSFDTEAILIAWNWDVWDCKYYKWKFEAYQRTYVLDDFDERIDIHYAFHLLSWKLKWHVLKQIKWSAIPYIKLWALQNFEIPLPPLETQKAIVAKLDQIFAELDQTRSEIQKNLDNTDELWKSSLNQAFQGDWEVKKLGEITKIIWWWTPSKSNKSYYENWDISRATVRDMSEDTITDTELNITELWLKNSSSNIVPKEWIVIATRVWLWKVCYLWKETAINQDLKGIIPHKWIKKEYLFYYFKSISDYIISNWTWATVKWVSLDFVKELKIPFLSVSEQEKIVEHLDQISKEVKELKSKYQSQLDNLEELKKSVLDKAFKWELGE